MSAQFQWWRTALSPLAMLLSFAVDCPMTEVALGMAFLVRTIRKPRPCYAGFGLPAGEQDYAGLSRGAGPCTSCRRYCLQSISRFRAAGNHTSRGGRGVGSGRCHSSVMYSGLLCRLPLLAETHFSRTPRSRRVALEVQVRRKKRALPFSPSGRAGRTR